MGRLSSNANKLKNGVCSTSLYTLILSHYISFTVWYQDRVIQIVKSSINHLGGVQGHQLSRRPFQVTWFSNQLSMCVMLSPRLLLSDQFGTSCLLLWNYDRSLKNALVLGKSILLPVEVMNRLWPCPSEFKYYTSITS